MLSFFSILLLQKKPRALHDKILIFWLLYLGLFIGVYAFYSHELFTHFQLLSISLISLLMLHGPFLYLYIKTLVADGSLLSWKDLVHLIPFVLFNLYITISSFIPDISQKLNIDNVAPGNQTPVLFSLFLILTAFSGTLYFLLTFRLFKKLDLHIFNNFSNSANIDLYWIRKLVLVFGIVWTALISVTVIHHVFNMFFHGFLYRWTIPVIISLRDLNRIFWIETKSNIFFSRTNSCREVTGTQTKYSGSRLTGAEAKTTCQKADRSYEISKSHI